MFRFHWVVASHTAATDAKLQIPRGWDFWCRIVKDWDKVNQLQVRRQRRRVACSRQANGKLLLLLLLLLLLMHDLAATLCALSSFPRAGNAAEAHAMLHVLPLGQYAP